MQRNKMEKENLGGAKMLFGLFKRKDPICGMNEEKGKGLEFEGKWFCSKDCKTRYGKNKDKQESCCCGGHDKCA